MTIKQTGDLSQEMFQVLKQFSRVKWENKSIQELKPSESELLGTLYLTLSNGNGNKALASSAISNLLNITPADVAHHLNPLESGGFIKRHKKADPDVLPGLDDKGKLLGSFKEADLILWGLENQIPLSDLEERFGKEKVNYIQTLVDNSAYYRETPYSLL